MADSQANPEPVKRGLTDMSGENYDVNAAKARHAAGRRKHSRDIRDEGNYTEDGELFKKAFDWQVTRRLLRYFTPYRPQLVSGILSVVGLERPQPSVSRTSSGSSSTATSTRRPHPTSPSTSTRVCRVC